MRKTARKTRVTLDSKGPYQSIGRFETLEFGRQQYQWSSGTIYEALGRTRCWGCGSPAGHE